LIYLDVIDILHGVVGTDAALNEELELVQIEDELGLLDVVRGIGHLQDRWGSEEYVKRKYCALINPRGKLNEMPSFVGGVISFALLLWGRGKYVAIAPLLSESSSLCTPWSWWLRQRKASGWSNV
jgi:hypothetical protein